jgi:hypothetical protein
MKFNFNARAVAENSWGRGGTKAYRTNRNGVYYFSCSGHGGYIVKPEALTKSEIESIEKYMGTVYINLLTNIETGEVYGVDYGPVATYFRNKRFKYPSGAKVEWRRYDFYMFEEDADWIFLEYFTDIRVNGKDRSKEELQKTFDNHLKYLAQIKEDDAVRNSGKFYVTSARSTEDGNVHVIFRNNTGSELGRIVSSAAYENRYKNTRVPLLEQFESEGSILGNAGTNF